MSRKKVLWRNLSVFFSMVTLALLVGCDHNGDHNDDSNTSSLNGTISGTATKGPVADAFVTAFSIHMDNMMGASQVMMGGGMMGGGNVIMPPGAGTMGLADAMMEFVNSPKNRSGVTFQDMQPLIDKLEGSDGTIVP